MAQAVGNLAKASGTPSKEPLVFPILLTPSQGAGGATVFDPPPPSPVTKSATPQTSSFVDCAEASPDNPDFPVHRAESNPCAEIPTKDPIQSKKRPVEGEFELDCLDCSTQPTLAKAKALESDSSRVKSGSIVGVHPAVHACWVSVDFNGCLNVAVAGDSELSSIHPSNVVALREFLDTTADHGVRVGITSYIGLYGGKSQERRTSLLNTVRDYNSSVSDPRKRLGLKIVDSRDAKGDFLKNAKAFAHIDDRLSTLNGILEDSSGVKTFWCTQARSNRTHAVVRSVREAIDLIKGGRIHASLHPNRFDSFWAIP